MVRVVIFPRINFDDAHVHGRGVQLRRVSCISVFQQAELLFSCGTGISYSMQHKSQKTASSKPFSYIVNGLMWKEKTCIINSRALNKHVARSPLFARYIVLDIHVKIRSSKGILKKCNIKNIRRRFRSDLCQNFSRKQSSAHHGSLYKKHK